MVRRKAVIALRCVVAFLLLAQQNAGRIATGLRWTFVGAGGLWLLVMLAGGGCWVAPAPGCAACSAPGSNPFIGCCMQRLARRWG